MSVVNGERGNETVLNAAFASKTAANSMAGVQTVTNTTQSTDKDTGAVILEGGLGVEKNINAGGVIKNVDTTESTDKDTGAIITEGGLGVEKNINAGGNIGAVGSLVSGTTLASEAEYTSKQIATPSTPAAGYNKIYPKSDGKWYNLPPSGVESQLGGGGGGGGSLQWIEDADAPISAIEYNNQVYQYEAALTQNLYALIRVPNGYTSGSPINLRMVFYSPDTSGTALILAQSTLIRTGADAISSTTNQRTTTNAAVNLATAALADKPYALVLDISETDGQINGVNIAAGDLIKVRLYRDTDTATSDIRVPVYGAEATFS